MNTWSKVALALVLIAIGCAGGWFVTRQAWRADVATVRVSNATVLQGLAESTARTADLVRKAFAAQATAFATIDAKYLEDKRHAQENADQLAADLRAGTVRLRNEWATCRATSGVLAAAGVARPDAGSDDREASASRIVRAARDADATIRALQQTLSAERQPGPAE